MNKLEEIMNEISKEMRSCENEMPHTFAQSVAIKFGKHLLEEASKNADAIVVNGKNCEINKQSITDTINKYL